jgi:tetratricopeptide (TPR) repeat protein
MLSNDYVTAETELQKAIEIDPLDELAPNSLGQLHNVTKRYDETEKALRKTVEINNESINHYNYARLLSDMGRCTKALDELEHVIIMNPKFVQVYGDMLSTLMRSIKIEENARRGIFKRSESLYKDALSNFPEVGPIHSGLSYVLMFIDRKDEANSAFLSQLSGVTPPFRSTLKMFKKFKKFKMMRVVGTFYRLHGNL